MRALRLPALRPQGTSVLSTTRRVGSLRPITTTCASKCKPTTIPSPSDGSSSRSAWMQAGIALVSAAFGAWAGPYFTDTRQAAKATAERKQRVERAAARLQVVLAKEAQSRADLLANDHVSCASLLKAAEWHLNAMDDAIGTSTLHADVYAIAAKAWAKQTGCTVNNLPDTNDSARLKLQMLRSRVEFHLATCAQLKDEESLNMLVGSVHSLDTVGSSYGERCHKLERDWKAIEYYQSLLTTTHKPDLFTVRARNNKAVAAYAHGRLSSKPVMQEFMRCAAAADALAKPFPVTTADVEAAVKEFREFTTTNGGGASSHGTPPNTPGHALLRAMQVGESSVVDNMFISGKTPTSRRVYLDRLERTKQTWRKAITARTDAILAVATSTDATPAATSEELVRLVHELCAVASSASTEGRLDTLRHFNDLALELDFIWWKGQGGAARVFVALALALELLLRHDCVDAGSVKAVEAEAHDCIQCAVSPHVARPRELAHARLADALLKFYRKDTTCVDQAAAAIRELDDGARSFRNARERAWASYVHEVLRTHMEERYAFDFSAVSNDGTRDSGWCKLPTAVALAFERLPHELPMQVQGQLPSGDASLKKRLTSDDATNLLRGVAQVRTALSNKLALVR